MSSKTFAKIASDSESLMKEKIFNRRAFIVIVGQIVGAFIIIARLVNLQVFSKNRYQRMSDQNQFRPNFIIPKRGTILDRNNQRLAYDKKCYNILVDPSNFKKAETIATQIAPLLNSKKRPKRMDAFIRKMKQKMRQNPSGKLVLWRNLQKEEIARIEYMAHTLPDFEIRRQNLRMYPFGYIISSIVGYLRHKSKSESIKQKQIVLKLINQDHKEGQVGIEKTMHSELSGNIGLEIVKVNAAGSPVGHKIHTKAHNGQDVKLTIDIELQRIATEALGEKFGSVSLIDLQSGDLMVAASLPSFDPTIFSEDIDQDEWSSAKEMRNAFTNRNLTIPYNPGSTFKIVSALNALRNGLNPAETFNCKGQYRFGNRVFHCLRERGHGHVNMYEAIARSCNCYFYNIGANTNIEDLHNTAIALGLAQNYNIGGLTTNKGIMPNNEWKMQRFGQKWIPGETLNTVIGQGYTECTPLQLAIMAGRIATGLSLSPRIILPTQNTKPESHRQLYLKKEHIEEVRKGMISTFTDKEGTCRYHLDPRPEYQMAGKTGTAQVISARIEARDLLANRVKEALMPHGLFVGYAPREDPRFAISVVVEHGKSGSSCLPVAKKVMNAAIDKYIG